MPPQVDHVIVIFRMLVLQSLYNLSDEQVEYRVRDRLSFTLRLDFGGRHSRWHGRLRSALSILSMAASVLRERRRRVRPF
jgi:IS5 family transposase